MLEPIALDAIVFIYLGPKIKQAMKTMCEHTNEDSGILTPVGWVDLKTTQAKKLTAKGAKMMQSTASKNRILSCETELQASSDGSRLMGEPPYHLRKTRKCWGFGVGAQRKRGSGRYRILKPFQNTK